MQEIIKKLIESKREGLYWDFKREPHSNNSDLVHDILCFSNSLYRGDKYIILGVTDPHDGCQIIGLIGRRKSQSDYIDLLRSIKFSADNRPEIELRTLTIAGKELDIIVVLDSTQMPFILSEDYCGLKANYIYTRVGDTNTPKNRSADYSVVEKIWRQRFGLDLIPSERFKVLLDDIDNWKIDLGNKQDAHYIPLPEYQIYFSEPKPGREIYSYYYPNQNSFFGIAVFKYLATPLFELEYAFLDEFRIPIVVPKREVLEDHDYIFYYYHVYNTIEYKLFKLIGLKSYLSYLRKEYQPILIFRSDQERIDFKAHIQSMSDLIEKISCNEDTSVLKRRMKEDGYDLGMSADLMAFAVKEYYAWKN